ncbi:MAG: 1-acyl-sn-glycerol-3-phosphate acyltransferase [Persephonella sp.]|nr:1-acyl-sn-glycerol-3-phosphate acyltransferase [Persephonella sp.]
MSVSQSLNAGLTVQQLSTFINRLKTKFKPEQIDWEKILKGKYPPDISEKNPLILLKRVLRPVFKLYFHLDISGIENLPDSPFILAPNHQSFLDGFLIVSALPDKLLKNTYFLAEEIYFPEGLRKDEARVPCHPPST